MYEQHPGYTIRKDKIKEEKAALKSKVAASLAGHSSPDDSKILF